MPRLGYYPTGPCRVINVWPSGNPAAGAELTTTVPPGKIWKVKAVSMGFVTSGTVATRRVNLRITNAAGTSYLFDEGSTNSQAASITNLYMWYASGVVDRTSVGVPGGSPWANRFSIIFPPEIVVPEGYIVSTLTANIQVGDQYQVTGAASGLCLIEEYLMMD